MLQRTCWCPSLGMAVAFIAVGIAPFAGADDPVPEAAAVDRAAWAGPMAEQITLAFGDGGNAKIQGAADPVPWADDPAAVTLRVGDPRVSRAWGAAANVEWGAEPGVATGAYQFMSFEIKIEAEAPVNWLIQIDEEAGDKKLRGRIGMSALRPGDWQTVTASLVRNETSSDRRPGSTLAPDGTPLTRLGLRFDPKRAAGLTALSIRNIRFYEQDLLAHAPADALDAWGQGAIHRDSMMGDAERVGELLAAGHDVNLKNKYLYTPLALAVISHDEATVAALIDAGADVGAQRQRGFTPLYDAAADGQIGIMKRLLAAGADPRQQTEYKFEPLYSASHHGRLEAVELLVADERVDINGLIAGFLPLHVAAQGGKSGPHRAVYDRMLELGAKPELCSAAAVGDIERLRAMLDADPDAAKTYTILGGWTPLHDAVRNVRVEAVTLLLEHGADPNAISGKIDFRSTPLHWLSSAVKLDVPKRKVAILEEMAAAGADLNARDQYGLTPLDRYRAHRSQPLVETMRELGGLTASELDAEQEATAPAGE